MFLFIDKPVGITSHGVVHTVRSLTGEKKVGHGGTLDPFATGLLIVAIGRNSTKRLGELLNDTNKTYVATITLGEERTTDDVEGSVVTKSEIIPDREMVESTILKFIGQIEQTPPQFSAIKIAGQTAYSKARKGEHVELKSKKVTIHVLTLISYRYPDLLIETTVSGGTYIRALARDIGKKLGSGAYVSALRRTKIGGFLVDNAVPLETLNSENVSEYGREL